MNQSISTAAVLLLGLACARSPADGRTRFEGSSMGTTYAVEIVDLPAQVEAGALRAEVERILRSVDERMSTYDPKSELSRFNASTSTDWFAVTADTLAVVEEARRVSRLTAGAFDVTVGPLVELWGFGASSSPRVVPAENELAAVRASVGFTLLETRASPPALRKRAPGLQVDLSGLAKGFAVDAVAHQLDDAGVRHYLIELGGELRARGRNAAGRAWRVGIEEPAPVGGRAQRVLALADRAMATSGDYRSFFEQDGRRYSHVIDPRTGVPVEHGVASVTVLAATTMEADAFATALMVLDPDQGWALAEELGLAVRWLVRLDAGPDAGPDDRTDDDYTELKSSAFDGEVLP